MKFLIAKRSSDAFTRRDLLAVVIVVGMLIGVLFPWLNTARNRARSICCNCNLKQIGLGFRIWSGDHTNQYPMSVSTNFGGTQEYVKTGQTFRHFQVMSNELNAPIILVCPEDSRLPARDFNSSFSNSNVSYFIGIEANEANPQAFLSGDRDIIGPIKSQNGILELTTNQAFGWGKTMHNGFGNILMADASVQQFTTADLQRALENTGIATNRLALP